MSPEMASLAAAAALAVCALLLLRRDRRFVVVRNMRQIRQFQRGEYFSPPRTPHNSLRLAQRFLYQLPKSPAYILLIADTGNFLGVWASVFQEWY